ncbi:MAG: phosphotransferase family protein [Dehalococcoidia bacterium]
MADSRLVRPPPSADALQRLRDRLAPGSQIRRLRRLRGGLGSAMHAVDLEDARGARQRLAIRGYFPKRVAEDPELPARAWQTLGLLARLQLNAPRPVLFDGDGTLFGSPTLVMTRLPGRGRLRPHDLAAWTGQLAAGLAAIHRAALTGLDSGFLRGPGHAVETSFARIARSRARLETHPDGVATIQLLEQWRPRIRRVVPALAHGDYWAGNTLWLRNRLTAVVDWDDASIDPPGFDVGYCRMDLAMLAGSEAPDLFLQAYEAAAGRRIPQLFFWDLLAAVRAMPEPERWLPGYHDLGRAEITPHQMRERLHAFIVGATARGQ